MNGLEYEQRARKLRQQMTRASRRGSSVEHINKLLRAQEALALAKGPAPIAAHHTYRGAGPAMVLIPYKARPPALHRLYRLKPRLPVLLPDSGGRLQGYS